MTLHVAVTGRGPDVVLLHGFALHGAVWGSLTDALGESARVHAIDLPGHGSSPWRGTSDTLAGLAAEIEPHLPDRAVVLGWSLGGMIALEIARRHPGHIAALLLVTTTPRFVRGVGWTHAIAPQVLEGFAADLARDPARAVQTFLSLQVQGATRAHETLRRLRRRFARGSEPDRGALAAGLEILRNSDLRNALPSIEVPAVVLAGERDRLTPPAAGEYLASTLRAARFRCVRGAGHAPFLSHPEVVLTEARALLDAHAPLPRHGGVPRAVRDGTALSRRG